ncbi:MAG: cupin domain-containing protein [Hyphomicrobiaceae bacterium]|nr:cupin domain-containing protein [Hyphomicrobiaceae bacterium]
MSALFAKSSDVAAMKVSAVEGVPNIGGDILVKPMMEGDEMTALEIFYGRGIGTGLHKHAHESIVYVIKGRLQCVVGDVETVAEAGDSCRHPAGVMHAVMALEDSLIVEIKSPRPQLATFFKTKG